MAWSNDGPPPPNLQEMIEKAGSPVNLLWKQEADPWLPPVVEREYVGWKIEQTAGQEGVSLSDLSHHMFDLWIEGPDALRLLSDFSANDYTRFEIGQAKQIIPVTGEGLLITDGIVMRWAENKFTVTGVPASQTWIMHNGYNGGYDVQMKLDPTSDFRGGDPIIFRYQVQGPNAMEVINKAFGDIPKTKFFHWTPVSLDGREMKALRHGMTGQPGYEFIGDWKDAQYVKDKLFEIGEPLGMVHVGKLAYATNGIESGWVPSPIPAIYSSPNLKSYRQSIPIFSYEGQFPLYGSYYSPNIEDYYLNPYELGYGRSISFNHDFLGREALQKHSENVTRSRVTLVLDPEDANKALGDDGFLLRYARNRVEQNGNVKGMSHYAARIDRHKRIIMLAVVHNSIAAPGTKVSVVWGNHAGPKAGADPEKDFHHLSATVQPSPYSQFARTGYRAD